MGEFHGHPGSPAKESMKDRNIGKGPFTAGGCQIDTDEGYDGAAVFDVTGAIFCIISADMAVGGNMGARARATRIAEALNK